MGERQKLNIAQVTPYYHPSSGGVEVVVRYISEELARRGHRVRVLTARRIHKGYPPVSLKDAEVLNGVQINRFRTYGTIGHHSFFPGSMRELLRGHYDIVHSHCYRHPHGELVSVLGRLKGCPTILHVHGGLFPSSPVKGLFYRIYDLLAAWHILNRFTHYIALTNDAKRALQERGAVISCITVIPNTVAAECFENVSTDDFCHRYGLTGRRVILFLGSLHPLKRPDLLIPVLSKVVSKVPEAFLLYAGPDAGEFVKVDKLAKELKMEGHMKWVGPLQGTEKQQALEVCEFLILPSDSEPFGIVMLEAMAHGKPVIATATEGARAIIEHNVTGIIAGCGSVDEMADGVLRLLRQPDLSREMGEKARKMVSEKYTIQGVADQVEALYYRLLYQHNQRGKS